jgi:3-hydroxyacyl-CoA dehydrogenase
MKYEEKLENVTVMGAAGKMGSGILYLTATEMTRQKFNPSNKDREFVLYALDTSHKSLAGLMSYIREQAWKFAEKNIVFLRKVYQDRADLIDNEQIIRQYAQDLLGIIRPVTRIESAFDSYIIFEAISENPDLKVELLSTINKNNRNKPWFFTNTSAIPISWLDQQAALNGRIMGVHFYNPPAVQKLVEVIKTENTRPELSYFVADYIKNIGKISVPSYDVAGFIGNGYFMRDIIYAEKKVEELKKEFSHVHAVYMINKISQDFLIRPMGIFQLVDYVGIDVVQFIMSVMKPHITRETIHSPLIDQHLNDIVKGGQYPDGSQKDGIFKYEKGQITAVYDPGKKRYIPVSEFSEECDEYLGELPADWQPWRKINRNPEKNEILKKYFENLRLSKKTGALLAREYLAKFREIASDLVKNKVAFKFDDVNAVLIYGFHHAYGPVNDYL